jgi:hypothetical protein
MSSGIGTNMNGLIEVKRDLTKEESDIIDEFHRCVFKLIRICKKIEPNNMDIEWLQNKLSLARDIDPLLIIHRARDKVWIYRNEILNRDMDFFMNNKFNQFIKNDENKTFMYTLVNLIKKRFLERSEEEKKMIWDLSNDLLAAVVKYKKITGDYKQN